jgi:beta-barrel assembly-enhancing protease
MNFSTKSIALFMITGFLSVIAAQTLPSADLLKKKDLSAIKQEVGKQVTQVKQAAVTALQTVTMQIPLTTDLPDSDEIALGRETAGRLLAASSLYKNDSLEQYVNLVGMYVASRSPRANLPWTFGVIESDDINAFALPGGYVFVTTGLYKTLRNEAELAAILGHEIAHVNLRHHVRLLQKERLLAQGSNFLSGQTRQEALKALCGQGAEICARSLDRNAEFESDCTGLQYAASSGYDPYAYLDVLDRMGASNQTDRLAMLYKTHPLPRDRLAELEKKMTAGWVSLKGVVPARWMPLP